MQDKNAIDDSMPGKVAAATNIGAVNMTGNKMPPQVLLPRAAQVDRASSGKKKFPIGWLLPVAVLSFFLAQVWSYAPVFRGIVSLFVFSKFLVGLCGAHFLL